MNNNIKLTPEAEWVIEGLRHPAGTLDVYRNTLTRIFNQVLHTAEDLGMDDLEALETLRALDMIRHDLTALATTPATDDEDDEETDEDDMHELTYDELSGIPERTKQETAKGGGE